MSKETLAPKEKQNNQTLNLLVVEDQFVEAVQKGLGEFEWINLKIVQSLVELQCLRPDELNPDLIILDKEIPRDQKSKPVNLLNETNSIAVKKFPEAAILGFSSYYHNRQQGELGNIIGDFIETGIATRLGLTYKQIGNKAKPHVWQTVLSLSWAIIDNGR